MLSPLEESGDSQATTILISHDEGMPEGEQCRREEELQKQLDPVTWAGKSNDPNVIITEAN